VANLTQKERLASVEASQTGHVREHELNDRVWSAKLDAIDARIRGMERILLEVRLPQTSADSALRKFGGKRDLGVISGSAVATSLFWWAVEMALGIAVG
jgi:hypothetical protein